MHKLNSDLPIPTRKDWNYAADDLDAADAYSRFANCSANDAAKLFSRDVLACAQDLRFMPHIPFVFYMRIFCDFVLAGDFGESNAAEVADALLSVAKSRASELAPFWGQVERAMRLIIENQLQYGASPSIFGDFAERAAEVVKAAGGRI